jgi:hypothetical protein
MAGAARYGALRHLRGGQNLRRVSAAEYTPVAPIAQVANAVLRGFDFRAMLGYTVQRSQSGGSGLVWDEARPLSRLWTYWTRCGLEWWI